MPEQPEGTYTIISVMPAHAQPLICATELLEAVRASLRVKVAALAEDNWMYEPEEHIRGS
jgi:hypothetical protein